jgi:hypothetical protein
VRTQRGGNHRFLNLLKMDNFSGFSVVRFRQYFEKNKGRYMFSMMALANSEHFKRLAPSICCARS